MNCFLVLLLLAGGALVGEVDRALSDGPGRHLWRDIPALDDAGNVQVVIEIPAGTAAKWEVDKGSGQLIWEMREGQPRVIQYLPYPVNYGFIPSTFSDPETGGDGDPLDVLVLGEALPRGALVSVRLIGVIEMMDSGESDDKLIAVHEETPFADLNDLLELETRFPGVLTILTTWFNHYKGPGFIEILGVEGPERANAILKTGKMEFKAMR